MSQNINIHLPDHTLVEIDRLAQQGDRSRFIIESVQFCIHESNEKTRRDLLKEGAIVRAQRDLALAQEWFGLDEVI